MHHHHHDHHIHHERRDSDGDTRRRRGDFGFGGPFGPFPFGGGRGRFRGGPGGRAPRGNVRAAILALLQERPMHGYEIIAEIESRSGGVWRPSPGSVYPTLQMLGDEGLVSSIEDGGKRRYELTEAGKTEAANRGDGPAPWEEATQGVDPRAAGFRQSVELLVSAVAQVFRAGGPAELEQVQRILDEARKNIYGLLAGDLGSESSQ